MMTRDLGQGGKWYVVCVHYPSALMARLAWERCQARLSLAAGDEGIGLVRMSARTRPVPGRPEMDVGELPDNAHPVVAVTLSERTAQKAERLLRDGTPWVPTDDFADTLIFRRAKIVTEAQRQRPGSKGRLVIRRPDERGAFVDGAGNVHEQPGGEG